MLKNSREGKTGSKNTTKWDILCFFKENNLSLRELKPTVFLSIPSLKQQRFSHLSLNLYYTFKYLCWIDSGIEINIAEC